MVPQQQDSPSSSGIPMFGSLLVDKNSTTPYSDATQVCNRRFKLRYLEERVRTRRFYLSRRPFVRVNVFRRWILSITKR